MAAPINRRPLTPPANSGTISLSDASRLSARAQPSIVAAGRANTAASGLLSAAKRAMLSRRIPFPAISSTIWNSTCPVRSTTKLSRAAKAGPTISPSR